VSEAPAERLRCSAKGCRERATTDLGWRNPRLHDAARVKHWLACDEHADHLADFLARRGFLLTREPLERNFAPVSPKRTNQQQNAGTRALLSRRLQTSFGRAGRSRRC
jgi:hypothetical protein